MRVSPIATDAIVQRLLISAAVFVLAVWGGDPCICGAEGIDPEPPVTDADREHWSFAPLSRPSLPDVGRSGWPRNPVDRFVLARMEERELAPAPEADRLTLIRRVTFDLTGLPPTPDEVEAFLRDDSPDAYERLVDRLLASDAYGARMAQHWLDLARFAETDGFEHDLVRPNAWRYRDWVIAAFNEDLPYDEFVRLQVAGDELRPDDPAAAVATGFLLCGPDMPDINSQDERRHVVLNEMAATVGSVFLGLQAGCAQCHDHKWDPISQLDFYRLRAFFESADLFGEKPLGTREQLAQRAAAERERGRRVKQLEGELRELETQALQRIREERGEPKLSLKGKELAAALNDEERARRAGLSEELAAAKSLPVPELPMGRVLRERSAEIPVSYLRVRGDFRRNGPEVRAAFPRIANAWNDHVPPPEDGAGTTGQRSALAHWLTRPDHPLTTRVIVNRLWQQHFGRGIAAAPSDFGLMGDEPTHPELLDWLATELPRRGWSLKAMHRLMVTSATYRQASRPPETDADEQARWRESVERDPSNRFWSRMPRQRLDGEAIRDAMLAAAGTLNDRRGGPGVRPPLPPEVVVTLLRDQWKVTEDEEDHHRRSIYLFVRRNLQYPLFAVFDKPDTNATCARRNRSTTAPQSLVLLNSELSMDVARALAGLILREAADRAAQVELCYRRVLSRPPTAEELRLALAFLEENAAQLREERRDRTQLAVPTQLPADVEVYDAAALTDLCLALFNANEFVYVD